MFLHFLHAHKKVDIRAVHEYKGQGLKKQTKSQGRLAVFLYQKGPTRNLRGVFNKGL